jgi:hypothetical protein
MKLIICGITLIFIGLMWNIFIFMWPVLGDMDDLTAERAIGLIIFPVGCLVGIFIATVINKLKLTQKNQ